MKKYFLGMLFFSLFLTVGTISFNTENSSASSLDIDSDPPRDLWWSELYQDCHPVPYNCYKPEPGVE